MNWQDGTSLPDFLAGLPVLTAVERARIIDQSIRLLDDYYVHLPQKIARHGIDPLADLAALRLRAGTIEEAAFHEALCTIFARLHDLHTQYALPTCYQGRVALLPFKLGCCTGDGVAHYLVTARLASYPWRAEQAGFDVGAEILTWCGMPIADAVRQAAQRSGGAGAEARAARALAALTLAPMERQPPPSPATVALTYRDARGHGPVDAVFSYMVFPAAVEAAPDVWRRLIGVDHEGEMRRHASRQAYHAPAEAAEGRARAAGRRERVQPYPETGALPTIFPTIFEARPIDEGRFGYLRIHSFHPPADLFSIEALLDLFVGECAGLLAQLPKQGLVLDVRGNGGGCLPLAEALLQMFTPRPITPQSLQVRASPAMLTLAGQAGDLAVYGPSLPGALLADPPYSAAFPLTDPAWCNGRGQLYHGPVVLLVDARCYSATDAFAAGFQDHAIGTVLGVAATTGAGGANVWGLADFPPEAGLDPVLPGGASLRVALRRTCRVGPRAGVVVEEAGVRRDHQHAITRDDLLHEDRDLLARAADLLAARPWYQLDAALADGAITLAVRGIETVRMQSGDAVWSEALAAGPAAARYTFALPALPGPGLVAQGFASGHLVAARRVR